MMKKEYTKPSTKAYTITIKNILADSEPKGLNGYEGGDGLSKKQGSSMWEDMDEE